MMTGSRGTFVISWSQTEIDGLSGAPVAAVDRGASWLWSGDPVQIDAASDILHLGTVGGSDDLRRRAARGVRRLVGHALVQEGVREGFGTEDALFDRSFTVTDGRGRWLATMIEMDELARPLLMFNGQMPPVGTRLWVAETTEAAGSINRITDQPTGVICFTPTTMLDTPDGACAVEDLVAGDKVQTRDSGAQEVLWVGQKRISGARLYAMPELRPVRIRQSAMGDGRPADDLIVSPDHKVLLTGGSARVLYNEPEVLVAARDLIDDHRITRDLAATSVTYIHLMLADHHIVWANGVETESFHPASMPLEAIEREQRERLFDVMPVLEDDPEAYGPMSRRILTGAEAALFRHPFD